MSVKLSHKDNPFKGGLGTALGMLGAIIGTGLGVYLTLTN